MEAAARRRNKYSAEECGDVRAGEGEPAGHGGLFPVGGRVADGGVPAVHRELGGAAGGEGGVQEGGGLRRLVGDPGVEEGRRRRLHDVSCCAGRPLRHLHPRQRHAHVLHRPRHRGHSRSKRKPPPCSVAKTPKSTQPPGISMLLFLAVCFDRVCLLQREGRRFVVSLNNGQRWVIYASEAIGLSTGGQGANVITASAPFTGVIRVAIVPPGEREVLTDMTPNAAFQAWLDENKDIYPTGGKAVLEYEGNQ